MPAGNEVVNALKTSFWLFVSIFVWYKLLNRLELYFTRDITGYEIGNRHRLMSISRLICLMLHLSTFIYMHLFSYFDIPKSKSDRKTKSFHNQCLVAFIFVIIGAHISYAFYVFDCVPWLIFEVANLCCGLWMHLFFSSLFFYYGNLFKNLLLMTDSGTRFIQAITERYNIFKNILIDKQFQVKCTLWFTVIMSLIQWYASDKISVHHLEVSLRHPLPTSLKVVVVSDIHSGASVYKHQVDKVVDVVNDLNPDLIFIVGDTVDAPVNRISDRVESLKYLHSKKGTFMVTGNHEYYYGDWNEWAQHFSGMGIKVLQNNVSTIENICIVGLNDISSNKSGIYHHDMEVDTLRLCDSNQNIIVLEHNPAATAAILNAAKVYNRTVDLILSGHTHAGQFYVMVPYVCMFLPYWYGLYYLNQGTKLLVSAGTLYQTAPMKMVGMSQVWEIVFS